MTGPVGTNATANLLALGKTEIGIDDVHDYYSFALNKARIAAFERFGAGRMIVHRGDIGDQTAPAGALAGAEFDYIHFAAQVRVHR